MGNSSVKCHRHKEQNQHGRPQEQIQDGRPQEQIQGRRSRKQKLEFYMERLENLQREGAKKEQEITGLQAQLQQLQEELQKQKQTNLELKEALERKQNQILKLQEKQVQDNGCRPTTSAETPGSSSSPKLSSRSPGSSSSPKLSSRSPGSSSSPKLSSRSPGSSSSPKVSSRSPGSSSSPKVSSRSPGSSSRTPDCTSTPKVSSRSPGSSSSPRVSSRSPGSSSSPRVSSRSPGSSSSRPSSLRTSSGMKNRRKGAKAGVSAEPTSTGLKEFNLEKARVPKDPSLLKLLTEALLKNQYLRRLELQQIRDMVDCMFPRLYQQGEHVTKQGESGQHLFVLAEGNLEVFQNQKLISSLSEWTVFGELAVLYNCTRTASIRAVNKVKVFALDREVFQNVMRRTAENRDRTHREFLKSVSLLSNLPEDKLCKILDCVELENYDKGEFIIRQGEEGSTFYILSQGTVIVTQNTDGCSSPVVLKTLHKGAHFGEKALISADVRSANIVANEDGVQCLVIDRETFDLTVGTFAELQKHLEGYVAELEKDDRKRLIKILGSRADGCPAQGQWRKTLSRLQSQPLSPDLLRLKALVSTFSSSKPWENLRTVATLGVGGFGRVELVRLKDQDVSFALKIIKKHHVVENRQQEHVLSEKKILEETRSAFIVRLYRTFRDEKFVYLLLEACLGGELWSLLRDRGSFEDNTARFVVGCVVEAFDYLHRRNVLYRDLKPENLLLDDRGYCKLVDFGFSKRLRSGQRTWTFCGTPEYVAPEVVLNKGHGFSVDFWALGILLYELLTGSPPFSGPDQMVVYTFILKGVEKLDFNKKISKKPEDLIRKLCRRNPVERLGNLKNGITDIRKHRWFNGFNWEELKDRTMTSPLKREVSGPFDHSHFDSFPPDEEETPDELSGWDKDF